MLSGESLLKFYSRIYVCLTGPRPQLRGSGVQTPGQRRAWVTVLFSTTGLSGVVTAATSNIHSILLFFETIATKYTISSSNDASITTYANFRAVVGDI